MTCLRRCLGQRNAVGVQEGFIEAPKCVYSLTTQGYHQKIRCGDTKVSIIEQMFDGCWDRLVVCSHSFTAKSKNRKGNQSACFIPDKNKLKFWNPEHRNFSITESWNLKCWNLPTCLPEVISQSLLSQRSQMHMTVCIPATLVNTVKAVQLEQMQWCQYQRGCARCLKNQKKKKTAVHPLSNYPEPASGNEFEPSWVYRLVVHKWIFEYCVSWN